MHCRIAGVTQSYYASNGVSAVFRWRKSASEMSHNPSRINAAETRQKRLRSAAEVVRRRINAAGMRRTNVQDDSNPRRGTPVIRLRFCPRLMSRDPTRKCRYSAAAWLLGVGGLYYADKTPVKIQRANEKDDLNLRHDTLGAGDPPLFSASTSVF